MRPWLSTVSRPMRDPADRPRKIICKKSGGSRNFSRLLYLDDRIKQKNDMKTKRIFPFLCLSVALLAMTSCVSDYDPGVIPVGEPFYTNCPLKFYFVDENGEDLVKDGDTSTYPLAYPLPVSPEAREMAFPVYEVRENDTQIYLYNSRYNWIWKDAEENMRFAFRTALFGTTQNTSDLMYVYTSASAGADSLRVGYRYLSGSQTESGYWEVEVTSMKYNGKEILEGNDSKKVYIVKSSDPEEETVVKIGSPSEFDAK